MAFAQVIDRVFLLARSFNFSVPPYFISNVRALGELAYKFEVWVCFCRRFRVGVLIFGVMVDLWWWY